MKKIYFILFYCLISAKLFSSEIILLIEPNDNTNDEKIKYINYAVKDLILKHVFLYSPINIIFEKNDSLNYEEIKYLSTDMIDDYKVDSVITYKVERYKNAFSITYFIYDKKNKKSWVEYKTFNKEDNVYTSVNSLLNYIYKTDDEVFIDYDTYITLIGYYENLIKNNDNIEKTYEYFASFHKDNIYFNIDYIDFLLLNGEESMSETLINEVKTNLKKNHHYILYINSYIYYNEYKKNVLESDKEKTLEFINKAIDKKTKNHLYYNYLSKVYLTIGDYERSIEALKKSISIYTKDKNTLEELIYLMKINNKTKPQ